MTLDWFATELRPVAQSCAGKCTCPNPPQQMNLTPSSCNDDPGKRTAQKMVGSLVVSKMNLTPLTDRLQRAPTPQRPRRHDAGRVPQPPRQDLYFRSVRLTGELTVAPWWRSSREVAKSPHHSPALRLDKQCGATTSPRPLRTPQLAQIPR